MSKSLEEYLALPYTIILRRDIGDEIFVARVEHFLGVQPTGILNRAGALKPAREHAIVD